MLDAGRATLIDVRTSAEHHEARVEGSRLIGVEQLTIRHGELPREGDLLFICRTGVRSALACEYASALGHDAARLHNVEGGIVEWIASDTGGVARSSAK